MCRDLLSQVDFLLLERFFVLLLLRFGGGVRLLDESVDKLAVVANIKAFVFVIRFAQTTLQGFGRVWIVGDGRRVQPFNVFTFSDGSLANNKFN